MLIAFLIMLREGIEAALIVGIVAGFLKQSGHSQLMPKVWLGVALAVLMCLGIGYGIHSATGEIPQKEQEFVVGVIGLVAVAMLTYMILWMKKAARSMKQQLQDSVQTALNRGNGQGWALVGMAFLAVARALEEVAAGPVLGVVPVLADLVRQLLGLPAGEVPAQLLGPGRGRLRQCAHGRAVGGSEIDVAERTHHVTGDYRVQGDHGDVVVAVAGDHVDGDPGDDGVDVVGVGDSVTAGEPVGVRPGDPVHGLGVDSPGVLPVAVVETGRGVAGGLGDPLPAPAAGVVLLLESAHTPFCAG